MWKVCNGASVVKDRLARVGGPPVAGVELQMARRNHRIAVGSEGGLLRWGQPVHHLGIPGQLGIAVVGHDCCLGLSDVGHTIGRAARWQARRCTAGHAASAVAIGRGVALPPAMGSAVGGGVADPGAGYAILVPVGTGWLVGAPSVPGAG